MIIKCSECGNKFEHFTPFRKTSNKKICDECQTNRARIRGREKYRRKVGLAV